MLDHVRRPSAATCIATVALFVALGGTAYAGLQITSRQIANNTVRSADLRDNDVRGRDIRTGTIRSSDVADGTLRARDFAPGQLPVGPAGPAGAQGPQGPAGPAGPAGSGGAAKVVARVATQGDLPAGTEATIVAECQPGEQVVGGGVDLGSDVNDGQRVIASGPVAIGGDVDEGDPPNGWRGVIAHSQAGQLPDAHAYVLCLRP